MIINPTVKTMPLFSAIPKVEDVEAAKTYCSEHPFYSWHANYYTINRKKILILVNDLTLLTLVFQDVNAQNKKHLDEMIRDRLFFVLKTIGIKFEKIERYLDNGREIKVYKGHKRNITSIVNNNVMYANLFEYHDYLWAEVMDYCNNVMSKTIDYDNPIERTIKVFETF